MLESANQGEVRAGSLVLSLFANPLNLQVLRAHADGPLRLAELHATINWAAQTTLRAAVANLRELGALKKRKLGGMPHGVVTELTPAGEELLYVAEVLEAWLERAPDGPIAPDSDAAKGAVKALAGGWSSAIVRALSAEPLTLTELARLIPDVSYPTLERRLATMKNTGQIEPISTSGRGTSYTVTEWLRRAIAPLCAAGRCERRYLADDSAPITNIEVEGAFMLSIPLIELPATASGSCTLIVQTEAGEPDARGRQLSGVDVELQEGKVTSCSTEIDPDPDTWALGTGVTWLEAVIDGRLDLLRLGGAQPHLAQATIRAIRLALFNRRGSSTDPRGSE